MENAYKKVALVAGSMATALIRRKTSGDQLKMWIRLLTEALDTLKHALDLHSARPNFRHQPSQSDPTESN